MPRPSTTFQRLALLTTATTYLLIMVGGLVRASGAGLGCPDWPRCFGTWVPPWSAAELPPGFAAAQFNATLMWTEYLNRLLGVAVGLLILATLLVAWRHHRRTPRIFWPTLCAFLLVGFQGWLGGVVVQQELASWIVTLHMLVALIIVSLLLYVTVHAFTGQGLTVQAFTGHAFAGHTPATQLTRTTSVIDAARGVRTVWLPLLLAVTVLQIVLGTQVREGVDSGLAAGLARSEVLRAVGPVDGWHRELALVTMALTIAVWWLARRPAQRRLAVGYARMLVLLLTGLQIVVGASMAYVSLAPAAQVAHLTTATLLFGAQIVFLLLIRQAEKAATSAITATGED